MPIMPRFPIKMDIGKLGNKDAILKRKFRWTFVLADTEIGGEGVVTHGGSTTLGNICKISSRPILNFDEQQVQHVIEVINLPAKAQWDSITITAYDMAGDSYLYKWLISFYDPFNGRIVPIAEPISAISKPKKSGFLRLLNGHGATIEFWLLEGCWPVSIDWGELDYESSELANVSFKLRYDRAILKDPNNSYNPITIPLGF